MSTLRSCQMVAIGALTAALLLTDSWAAERLESSVPFEVAKDCAREGRKLQRHPACALGGSIYLIAWCDGTRQIDSPTADIYAARIDAKSGQPLDHKGVRICAAADLQEWPSVAFDGDNFLVVWQDFRNGRDYDVYAARVTPAGRVLDEDGFPVVRRASNQARPVVGFASGNFLVTWMDARRYPVYGLFAARVSPHGKVLDEDGKPLLVEDAEKIKQAVPPSKQWLGEQHYWWRSLPSRFHPSIASGSTRCLVTCLRDVHANQTAATVLAVDPADLSIAAGPVDLTGEPRDRVAACADGDGWCVAFDHWVSGWSPSPRLTVLRLDESLNAQREVPRHPDAKLKLPAAPLLDVQQQFAPEADSYQQGKGHFAFWQTSVAAQGGRVITAIDYGWRDKRQKAKLHYAIVTAAFDPQRYEFTGPTQMVAEGNSASRSVSNPVLVAGPDGRTLLIYESDAGIDRLTVEARLLEPK